MIMNDFIKGQHKGGRPQWYNVVFYFSDQKIFLNNIIFQSLQVFYILAYNLDLKRIQSEYSLPTINLAQMFCHCKSDLGSTASTFADKWLFVDTNYYL